MKVATKKVSPASKVRWDMSHVNMLYNVVAMALNSTYLAVTQSISAFYTLIINIQTNLPNIETLRNITRSPITGYAAQKKAVRVAMEAMATAIMNAAYAYAVTSNNPVLAAQMNNAASRMSKIGYRECLETVYAAIGNVTPFVTDGSLTPYNVTTGMMSVWQSLADQLSSLMTTPQNATATRTATNNNIQTLLLECMVMLTNSGDTVVSQLKDTNSTYYVAYWSSRRLHEHPISTQLRLWVTTILGNPVTQGEVYIVSTDRTGYLDNNGYCLVDDIPVGTYEVMLTVPSGDYTYGPFDFKLGQSLTLHEVVAVQEENTPSIVKSEETPSPETKSN